MALPEIKRYPVWVRENLRNRLTLNDLGARHDHRSTGLSRDISSDNLRAGGTGNEEGRGRRHSNTLRQRSRNVYRGCRHNSGGR